MKFQPLLGDCIASSVYVNGEQRGLNVACSLPEIAYATIETPAAGGTLELPVPQQIQAMEASVTKNGMDDSFLALIKPEPFDLIINVAQKVTATDGTSRHAHVKSFLRVIPKGIPSHDLTPGENSDRQITFSVLSFRQLVDGEEVLNIDIPKGITNIGGTDYMSDIQSML